MISDNTLRQNIKTVAWIFIVLGVCGLIEPASFRSVDDFFAGLTAGFTLSNIPLKLFCLLNIIAGVGLLRLCNFWRLYAIVLLWMMVIMTAMMILIFCFKFFFSFNPVNYSDLTMLLFFAVMLLLPGAMLRVLHTPRVRAMFTKEAAPGAAGAIAAPSRQLLRFLVIFFVLPLLQTMLWQDTFLPPMSKLKSHGIGLREIDVIVTVFAVIDLGLLLQYFRSKKTFYLVIDFIVFFLMMLACAGVCHLKERQIPPPQPAVLSSTPPKSPETTKKTD